MATGLVLEGGGMRGIYTSGVLDELLHQRCQLAPIAVCHPGIFKQSLCCRIAHKYLAGYMADFQRVEIEAIEGPFAKQLP